MLIQIKKTDKKTYKVDGNPYFIAGLIVFILSFIIMSLVTGNLLSTFIFTIILTLFVVFITYLKDQTGKKKHKTIANSKLYQDLIKDSFEIEQVNEYVGLIGNYKNTAVRIYYDWNKIAEGWMSFGDIVLVAYYEPVVLKTEPDMLDADRLNQLNEKFKTNVLFDKRQTLTFFPSGLIREINYYTFTKALTIITELDKMTSLIIENNLICIDKEKLSEYQSKYGDHYAPQIETYIESGK